jgi:hypothetical protein
MAKSILDATPENQKQLQDLFDQSQSTSAHGMDVLAQTMYEKSGLATDALRKMYADTQAAQVQALADEAIAYANAQADIQTRFNDTMAKVTADRDTAIADANAALNQALQDATGVLNATLDDTEKAFNDKLKSMGAAVRAFKAEIAALKAELAGIDSSKTISPISGKSVGTYNPQNGAGTSIASNYGVGAGGATIGGSGVTINNNIQTSTNASAGDIANAVTNATKLNAPIISMGTVSFGGY